MWLVTTRGFYSVVEDHGDPDGVPVRARVREDLESLADLIPGLQVEETPERDYRFRASVGRDVWASAAAELAREIDYPNFKNAVAERQGPGRAVARIVRACSDTDEEPKPPWRPRKETYIAAIATKRPDELRVSLADKLHNARAILLDFRTDGDALWARFSAGRDEQLWYYGALASGFEVRRGDLGNAAGPAVDELRRVVDEIAAVSS